MKGKTKSILMQVAAYIAAGDRGGPLNIDDVEANYTTLIALHEKFGIDADEGASSGWGGKSEKQPAPQGVTFFFQNIPFEDFRTLKAAGTVKETFPDFRTATGVTVPGLTNDRGSVWMFDRDGSAKAEVAELVTAADAAAVLA